MHPTASKFRKKVREEFGLKLEIEEFPKGTKTARDAAAAIGCEVAQIAKSIVMKAKDQLVVVITSGTNRVNAKRIAKIMDLPASQVRVAQPDEVKETLGWSIGGVPPFCHAKEVPLFLDETLTKFDMVWAAAGTPHAVFSITSDDLAKYSGAKIAAVAE